MKPWQTRGDIQSITLEEYKNSVKTKTVKVKIGKKKKEVACFPKPLSSGKRKWVPGVKIGTDKENNSVYWASYSDQANHYKEKANQTSGKQKRKNNKISEDFAKRAKSKSKESKACKSVAVLKLKSKKLAGLALVQSNDSNLRSANPEEFGMRNLFGSSTNLAGLNDNGVLVSALGSSSVNVQELVDAPDGSIYIIFNQKIDFSDPDGAQYGWVDQKSACAFARVLPNSTKITCVDDEVESVTSVQFDASGRVYYLLGQGSIRRANPSTSAISTMVQPRNGYIQNYRVTGNGYLIVRGSSGPNSWVRAYSPSREATDIGANSWGGVFDVFPDGNVYYSNGNGEIFQFDTESLTNARRSWIGHEGSETNPRWVSQNSWDIANASEFYRLPMGRSPVSDDRVYVVYSSYNGDNTHSKKAAQVYPTLIPDLKVGLSDVFVIEPAGSFIALSGKTVTGSGTQKITTYRTSILDGANQTYRNAQGLNGIEVFTMNYVSVSNELIINGQVLRTGVMVNGKYNLDTNTWTVTSRDTGRIDDLELFDN